MKKNGKLVNCAKCGKSIYKPLYILRKNKNIFCSQKCHYEFQKKKTRYEIINNYIKFKLYDKQKREYTCLIDIEDKYLLERSWFISFSNNGNSFWITNNKRQKLHRIILNCPDNKIVDHINHNTLDNRKQNLRICTYLENNQNKKSAYKTSTTGIRNVYYKKSINKYFCKVCYKGKSHFAGYFPNTAEGLKLAIDSAKDLRLKYLSFST